jgi:murein L,D-transpeptidase YcbB/YkuD
VSRLFFSAAVALLTLSSGFTIADPANNIATQVTPALSAVYGTRQFAPLWLDSGKPTPRASQAIEMMGHAADDALNAEDYRLTALQQQLEGLAHSATDQQLAAFDLAMSDAVSHYVHDLNVGRVDPRSLDLAIDITPRLATLPQHLQNVLTAGDLPTAIANARPIIPQYATLRQLLAEYRALAAQHPAAPALPPLATKKLSPGENWEGTPALAEWLIVLGDLPAGTPATELYDGAVVEGVKHFQLQHGQVPDGVIGKQTYTNLLIPLPRRVQQIELAMERLRWLDDSILRKRFIVINVPQFTLWAFAPDANGHVKPVLQMPVVVGQARKNETPLMIKNLSTLVFNPYWNVPRSITKKEMLPKLHADPDYLFKENMELVDSNGIAQGSAVGPLELHAISNGAYRIRQRPGTKNALGELKFVFPNDDAIYMHDTPSKSYFAKERRDLSHGCVRLGNPMGLALFVLETEGEWDEARINEKISTSNDQHLTLKERMPVLLLYMTANVDADGKAIFLQDIYGQDEDLAGALKTRSIR